jgi:hypothetical protein
MVELGAYAHLRLQNPPMSHETAKLLLEHADSIVKREEAIRAAMRLGMGLHEIEQYLDWLDQVRGPGQRPTGDRPPAEGADGPPG